MSYSQIITRSLSTVLSAALLTFSSPHAEVGDQLAKLLAGDGAAQDLLGISVAVSGTIAIVGAYGDDDNGLDSGSAYVYDTVSGLQLFKLVPSDGAPQDLFGYSVAISGTTAIIGAYGDDDNTSFSGSAYLFDVTTGLQTAKLLASDGNGFDLFGQSVSISGTTAIVGAEGDDADGLNSGSAYLFDTVTGMQIARLNADDAGPSDRFGISVSISGTTAIVGAVGDNVSGLSSGSAYLFDIVTGNQIAKLVPGDGGGSDFFGWAVAISGSRAVVGAFGDNDSGLDSGSAYLFDSVTGLLVSKLIPSDLVAGDLFGQAVAISGRTAIVSSKQDDENGFQSGSAYLFDTVTGLEVAKLIPDDGDVADYFSQSVGINGKTAIIGSYRDDDKRPESGSAYLFEALPPAALTSENNSISLSAGGSQALVLDGSPSSAGWYYLMLGSVTGTSPGIDFGGGIELPLNFDVYMNLTLFKPTLSAFNNFTGTFDGAGQAIASLTLPALMDPSLAGVTINHAYLAAAVFGTPDFASNAVSVMLVP
ncbi:MAG: hypothetical protein ACI87A_003341 [Planctomycetota bacterium]|jgi:hypothetical protein